MFGVLVFAGVVCNCWRDLTGICRLVMQCLPLCSCAAPWDLVTFRTAADVLV